MREEFEKWFLSIGGSVSMTSDEKYRTDRARMAWWAWQASRAAIEIDLDFIHPLNFDLHKIEEEITSHGIRIKGAE